MSTLTLAPVSYSAPTSRSPYLSITFANPSSSSSSSSPVSNNDNPLHPAMSIQLSLRQGDREAFMERLSVRDLRVREDHDHDHDDDNEGAFSVRVGRDGMPRFVGGGNADDEVKVWVYAWKGEKVLGSWEVGTL